jgi:hypothetical protein
LRVAESLIDCKIVNMANQQILAVEIDEGEQVDIMVVACKTGTIPHADWHHYLDMISDYRRRQPLENRMRMIVLSDGASPNAAQRSLLKARIGHRPSRVCVMTSKPLVRMAAVAVSVFNPNTVVLAADDVKKLVRVFRLTPSELMRVRRMLEKMKENFDSPSVKELLQGLVVETPTFA